MNLEQRVEALEQEVALLKGQIQATLLDIQEQLLNRTYPVLRGEAPNYAPPAQPTHDTNTMPAAAAPAPVRKMKLAEAAPMDDEDDDDIDLSMFRKLTTVEDAPVPKAASRPAPRMPEPEPEAWQSSSRESASYDWIELENWVSQKVEKLGIERTRELIDLYAHQERWSPQESKLLMQFVDIYEGAQKPILPKTPAPKQKPSTGGSTIVPQTRALVDEIRTELRNKNAAAPDNQSISEQQGLVLRLIAGILNAGDDTPPTPRSGRNRR